MPNTADNLKKVDDPKALEKDDVRIAKSGMQSEETGPKCYSLCGHYDLDVLSLCIIFDCSRPIGRHNGSSTSDTLG